MGTINDLLTSFTATIVTGIIGFTFYLLFYFLNASVKIQV